MDIQCTFKNFEPSDHLRKYAIRRFEKINRFLSKHDSTEVAVVLSVDKHRHKADIKISGNGLSVATVEETNDMYSSIDLAADKVILQVKKYAELNKDKRRSNNTERAMKMEVENYYTEGSGTSRVVIGENKFEPKPMYSDEAVLQLEQRSDDEFLVFLNADNERINILYRRKKGGFGIIDLT